MTVGFAPCRPPLHRPLDQSGGASSPLDLRARATLSLMLLQRKFVFTGLLRLGAPQLPHFLICDFSKLCKHLGVYILGLLYSKKCIFHHLFFF